MGDLNNNPVIMQYLYNNREHYKINFSADSLLDIQAILRTKQLYPLQISDTNSIFQRELYRCAKKHYKEEVRNKGKLYYNIDK